jgi:hypothetical protein
MADTPDTPTRVIDFREIGSTGLRRFSGFIFEEFLTELLQWGGARTYKEMSWNDATISACLWVVESLIRKVDWGVKPASSQPYDMEAADFLNSCRDDMSVTWPELINEIVHETMVYGYCVQELIYKRRCGKVLDPSMRSKHQDGRIGWRKISVRSTDTIYRWQFDDHGGLQGVEQLAPPHYYHVTIPVEKFLLFRTRVMKNNPEGRSLLRGCFRDWYMKKQIENIEAIGVERDLAGLPVALVPPELLSSQASQIEKNNLQLIRDIVTNIRRDEQEGVVFPQMYDANGKPMYELKLLSTGGQRQFDTDKIIHRYDMRIARTFLADFLLIGQEKVGTSSMVGSRQGLFGTALSGFLDIITDVFNFYAIPRLFDMNDFRITDYPKITHGNVGSIDLMEISKAITAYAGAGMPLFPDTNLENYLLRTIGAPERPDMAADEELDIQPMEPDTTNQVEIPASPVQTPTGLNKPSDTTPVNAKPPVSQVTTNESGNTERMNNTPMRQWASQGYDPYLGPQS